VRLRIAASDLALWTMTAVVNLFLFAALHLTAESLVDMRHTANFFPLLMLSMFAVFTLTMRRKLLFIPVLILAVFHTSTLFLTYAPLAKPGDWVRVASYIEAWEQPGQPIMLYPAGSFPSITIHYHGINSLAALPRGYDIKIQEPYNPADETESLLIESLTKQTTNHQRLWLVTTWECTPDDGRTPCRIAEDFFNQHYEAERDINLFRSRVRLFRRRI